MKSSINTHDNIVAITILSFVISKSNLIYNSNRVQSDENNSFSNKNDKNYRGFEFQKKKKKKATNKTFQL